MLFIQFIPSKMQMFIKPSLNSAGQVQDVVVLSENLVSRAARRNWKNKQ